MEPISTTLPRALELIFRNAFFYRNDRFRFRGVFSHQSPEVTFAYTNHFVRKTYKCEAGDLLIFLRDESILGKIKYRALLLQAKKLPPGISLYPKRIKKNDKEYAQYRLYRKWPKFSFKCRIKDGKTTTVKTYDFLDKCPHKGAQYLFLKEKRNSAEANGSTYVSESLPRMNVNSKLFSSVICDLIDGVDGQDVLPRSQAPAGSWSAFVWDIVAHVYYGKIAKCYKKGSRRISHYDIEKKFLNMIPGGEGEKLCFVRNVSLDESCIADYLENQNNRLDFNTDEMNRGIGVLMITRMPLNICECSHERW